MHHDAHEPPAPPPPPPDPAQRARDRARRRDTFRRAFGARVVLLVWSVWLLGSWVVIVGFTAPTPGARWMIAAAIAGLMLAYPLYRLSQNAPGIDEPFTRPFGRPRDEPGPPPPHPRLALLLGVDLVSMWLVLQAVVWPLMLVGDWAWERVVALDAMLLGWALLTASLVAVGCRSRGELGRSLTMLACAALLLAEPAVGALLRDRADLLDGRWPTWNLSPLPGAVVLTTPASQPIDPVWLLRPAFTLLAGGLAYFFALRAERRHRPSHTHAHPAKLARLRGERRDT